MPALEFFLSRSTLFTPDEKRLAIDLEKIIFKINHTVHNGDTLKGAFFSDIRKNLLSGTQYSDDFIITVLTKLENLQFGNNYIKVITKINNKYFSMI